MIGTSTQLRLAETIGIVTIGWVTPDSLCPQSWSHWTSSSALNLQLPSLGTATHPESAAKALASSIVSSRLDYCNSVLYGSPNSRTTKLQTVQNCLARTASAEVVSRSACILKSLHVLPVYQRIDFKLAILASYVPLLNQLTFTNSSLVSSLARHVATLFNTSSAPGFTNSNCIWQSCFQRGCTD